MYNWNNFRVNKKFMDKKLKIKKICINLPFELNITIKQSKLKTPRPNKIDSLVFKIFLKYFSHALPVNYIFEVQKTKKRLDSLFSNKLFLQLPEGMTMYFKYLNKIFKNTCRTVFSISVSCQVTYGACCIQDCLANYFGVTIMFHYGHSCLVSISNCIIPIIYIFVEIIYDYSFLIESLKGIFCTQTDKISITSTIQFSSVLKLVKIILSKTFKNLEIPQTKPLSPGEILGCTSFVIQNNSGIIYIGDGKFHVESVLFFNPNIKIIQFNPFERSLTLLGFKFTELFIERINFLEKAIFFSKSCNFIFGALGRQGNLKILKTIKFLAKQKRIKPNIYITTEIDNNRLNELNKNFTGVWVQLSCPRLSLDWGSYFKNLLLTPFEFSLITKSTKLHKNLFQMDFYSKIGKLWSNYSILKVNFVLRCPAKNFLILKKYNYFKNFILSVINEHTKVD